MNKTLQQPAVSIIIVYYKATNALINCVYYLTKLYDKTPFEVIIVDNNPRPTIPTTIQTSFKNIPLTVIRNSKNLGFGKANNIGAEKAKGKYFLFLNPDTLPENGIIDKLVNFFQYHPRAGYISPRQKHHCGKTYEIQGSQELTPLRAIFSETIIHTIWPNNPIANNYFLKNLDPKQDQKVAAAPAGACLIDQQTFNKIGGFDPKFFLYFEEHDLGQKIKKIDKEVWLLADPQITHLGEKSSKNKSTNTIFAESRYYYFYKYYGLGWAQLIKLISSVNKWHILLIGLCLIYSMLVYFKYY
ncbi:MAG: glycosyltransferase family 2 protein [Candidatus Pacebacteria bacterium]|nr:glycosyltransferase family 2 protein [Candidatus Paceibacterota bacterium]